MYLIRNVVRNGYLIRNLAGYESYKKFQNDVTIL